MAACIAIAALMFLPQVLAVDVNFGGASGSVKSSFSSEPGVALDAKNTLTGQTLAAEGAARSSWGSGVLEQQFEWTSWDGKQVAGAYTYLQDTSGRYKYAFTGTSGATTATAGVTIEADVPTHFLFGGYAYNPKDYAGAFVLGDGADTIKYTNSLSASASKVSATQSFSGTNLVNVVAKTWAERGHIAQEAKAADIPIAWAIVLADGDLGTPFGGWDDARNKFYSSQDMTLNGGSISAAKPYKASASVASNAASSSQSLTVSGDAGTADVDLSSTAWSGNVLTTGYLARTYLTVTGATDDANNVVYTANSKATSTQATSSQTKADVKSAANIMKGSRAESKVASDNLISQGLTTSDLALSGSDSATAKAGSAILTQKTAAKGANIFKTLDAHSTTDNYQATTTVTLAGARESTLSGQSTASATLTGASVLSSGKYKAVIAKDTAFTRNNVATSDLGVLTLPDAKNPTTAQLTYLFSDTAKATDLVIQAL